MTPPPLPFESLNFFGCEKCGGTYICVEQKIGRHPKVFNVSKTAVVELNRPKALCPDCGIEDMQITIFDLLYEDINKRWGYKK